MYSAGHDNAAVPDNMPPTPGAGTFHHHKNVARLHSPHPQAAIGRRRPVGIDHNRENSYHNRQMDGQRQNQSPPRVGHQLAPVLPDQAEISSHLAATIDVFAAAKWCLALRCPVWPSPVGCPQ